jgi:DNA-binding transcriptional regulator YhcF (GntR family)
MSDFERLKLTLDHNSGETKLRQLTDEIIRVIQAELNKGDSLPSINSLSRDLNISRDTVFKAYRELKRRKLVNSTPTKGYFVNRERNKVLLLLDFYSPFKEIVYQEFARKLDASYSIDLVFHHYNYDLFETVVVESAGRYSYYVIMNFDTQDFRFSEVLKNIDSSKLLLLDIPVNDWADVDPEKYSHVWQDFDEAVYQSLSGIADRIRKFRTFCLINPDHLKHPGATLNAFNRFCTDYGIDGKIISRKEERMVQKGDAYFILRQKDLEGLLADCREKNLEAGKDIGILAYNDSPLYEFVANGITVISADFKEMGQKAAQFVMQGKSLKETIPTTVIIRNSI